MMGARASLHADPTGRQIRKETQQSPTRKPPAQYRPTVGVYAMHLEHRLREIDPDCHGSHGQQSSLMALLRPSSLPRPGRAVARAVHAIKWAVQRARYMTLETIAPMRDDLTLMLTAVAA
jgi:hypothetical protein